MAQISKHIRTYVTVEPIMDFDLSAMVLMVRSCHPVQVSIGADTCRSSLSEPPKEKILELIAALSEETRVALKPNLRRLLK
jgi:hypothetical protein